MIKFNINGKRYGLEREEVEEQLINVIFDNLNNADNKQAEGMKGLMANMLPTLFMFAGIKKPKELKDMDNLEYAIYLVLENGLNHLDGKEIPFNAKELGEDE